MVKALGGVKVYLPEAVNDTVGNITLPAGCITLNGDQALDYVRCRHIGNGSDPARLARQQAFLSSVLQKVTSKGTLTNPVKLYSFLDAATASLSTDPALNSVCEARRPRPGHPRRRPRPDRVHDDPDRGLPADHNRSAVDRPGRPRLEGDPQRRAPARLRAQGPSSPSPSPSSTGQAAGDRPACDQRPGPRTRRAPQGAAKSAAAELTALGYHVVGYATAPTVQSTTVVRWSVPRDESARTPGDRHRGDHQGGQRPGPGGRAGRRHRLRRGDGRRRARLVPLGEPDAHPELRDTQGGQGDLLATARPGRAAGH